MAGLNRACVACGQKTQPNPSDILGRRECNGVDRHRPISRLLVSSSNTPEVRLLSSTGITQLHRYYGPFRHPTQPRLVRHRSLVGGHAPPLLGLPVFHRSPLPYMPTPLPRRNRWMLSLSRPAATAFPTTQMGRLPPHAFSGPAQRSLTFRPACSLDHPKVTFTQSTSTHLLPPAPPWLLPAERPIGRVGFAPTGDQQLSRHTE